jgi:hypothetical protein
MFLQVSPLFRVHVAAEADPSALARVLEPFQNPESRRERRALIPYDKKVLAGRET